MLPVKQHFHMMIIFLKLNLSNAKPHTINTIDPKAKIFAFALHIIKLIKKSQYILFHPLSEAPKIVGHYARTADDVIGVGAKFHVIDTAVRIFVQSVAVKFMLHSEYFCI